MIESLKNIYDKNSLYLQFNESSKDNKMLKNNFLPILIYLDSLNVNINNLLDFSNLLKSYSYKDNAHSNSDSNKMINRKDFTLLFRTLFKKTNDKNFIFERSLNRINYIQRNILFTYFSLKYENVMHEIANNYFNDFEFNNKINNKVDLSIQWNKYVDDLQAIKNCQINPTIQNDTPYENAANYQENIKDSSFERFDNHQENQNKYYIVNQLPNTIFWNYNIIWKISSRIYTQEIFYI